MTSLPLPENIDWDALMRDMAPPEWDLLLSAAAQNDLPKMRELVEGPLQVPVLHTNGVGQSALHIAALWGHAPIVQYLLAHGADVNAVNSIQGGRLYALAFRTQFLQIDTRSTMANCAFTTQSFKRQQQPM